MSSMTAEIAELTRAVTEGIEGIRKEYGADLDTLKKELDSERQSKQELLDRLTQAETEIGEHKELQARVVKLEMAKNSQRLFSLSTAQADPSTLKTFPDEEPKDCLRRWEAFITSPTDDTDIKELQVIGDHLLFLKAWMTLAHRDSWKSESQGMPGEWNPFYSTNPQVRQWVHRYHLLQDKFASQEFLSKAFNTSGDTEWIPDILSAQLIRFLEVRGQVIPLFRSFPMPGPTFRVPITTSVDQAVLEAAGTSATTTVSIPSPQLYSTSPISRITFDAIKLRAHKEVFEDFVEDSIVPMLPFMEQDMGDAIRRAIEDAIINADDTSAYQDADNTSATHARRAWQGLRVLANTNSSEVSAGTSANLQTSDVFDLKQAMGRYGIMDSDVTLICGIRSYNELRSLATLETLQNMGVDRATLLVGGVTELTGSRVVKSEFVREDLNTSGDYDSSTTNNTIIIAVHTPSWWLGNWRGITLESKRYPESDSTVVYARWRGDFQKVRAAAQTTEAVLVDVNAA